MIKVKNKKTKESWVMSNFDFITQFNEGTLPHDMRIEEIDDDIESPKDVQPKDILNKYDRYRCDIYNRPERPYGISPEAVAVLQTKRKIHDGRVAIVVFKNRVELQSQKCPYNYTSWVTNEVGFYTTFHHMEKLIREYIEVPQATCWTL